MTLYDPFRKPHSGPVRPKLSRPQIGAALLLCALALGGPCALAQGRGPGGGGPGGPGGPGGMMGAGRMSGFGGDRAPAPELSRPVPRSGPQLGLAGRWWDDGKTARKLGLRSEQQRRMDDIFEANKANLLGLLGNLQREENHLTSLPPGELQDEAKVFAAIDRVAQARAELEKANAHILMQIRQQMDPIQVAALDREIAANR